MSGNGYRILIVSIFSDRDGEVDVEDFISTKHSDVMQWFNERNCIVKTSRVMDPVRFGWVYHFTVEDVSQEIYLEYRLTWK